MAVNRSENKINVVKFIGTGSALGLIDPAQVIGAEIYHHGQSGVILGVASGNYTVLVTMGTSSGYVYPWDISMSLAHATGTWSYPSGDNSTEFGRHVGGGPFSGGVPQGVNTGVSYADGTSSSPLTYGK